MSLLQQPNANEHDPVTASAEKAFTSGDRSRAEPDSSSAEANYVLAQSLLEAGQLDKSAAAVLKTIDIDPFRTEAHNLLATIRLRQNRVDEALKSALAAVQFAKRFFQAHHTLGKCYLAQGENELALAEMRKAIEITPGDPESNLTLATAFQRLDRREEAEASLRKAVEIYPEYLEALNNLGMVLHQGKSFTEAETVLRKAILLKPDYTDAHNNLGFLLRDLGRPAEAAASFRIAHDLFEPHLVLREPTAPIARHVNKAKRFVRVCADIAEWKVTGKIRPGAWTDYRLLHQSTNGKSSDLFNVVLKHAPGKVTTKPKWTESPLFPSIKADDEPKIVNSLREDGFYVFERKIAPELIDEMMTFAMTAEARLMKPMTIGKTRGVFNPLQPVACGYDFDEPQMLAHPVFQKFAGDPVLLSIAQNYLGIEPKLCSLGMWWSAVCSSIPTSDMAQLFHADLGHIKWLKVFIYLTDVTDDAGPHSYVRGSHKADEEGRELRERGLVRISDEDIYKAYGHDRVVNLNGARGTVFITDSRGFHKGHNPRSIHRLCLQLYYVSSFYPDVINKVDNPLCPIETTLIDTIQQHPKTFSKYDVKTRV